MGAMALGCAPPAASSGSGAAPGQAADAAPAATASVDALPLSPFRAGKLAEDVAERANAAGGFTSRRTVVVADTFVLAMADPVAPIDAAALCGSGCT